MHPCAAYRSACAVIFTLVLAGCPSRPDVDVSAAARQNAQPEGDGTDGAAPDVDAASLDGTTGTAEPVDAGWAADADASAAEPDAGDADDNSLPEQPKLPPTLSALGQACHVGEQCASGSCVDGVCCSTSTCGSCLSCDVAGSLGTCAPLPKRTEDARGDCTGTNACDGAGHCAQYNGNFCKATADCLSGFCVDGVCCESACDGQCYSCNTFRTVRGMCLPITSGTDTAAAVTCDGTRSCSVPPGATQPVCLVVDGAT